VIELSVGVRTFDAVREMSVAFERGNFKRSNAIADFITRVSAECSPTGEYVAFLPLDRKTKELFKPKLRIRIEDHTDSLRDGSVLKSFEQRRDYQLHL